MKLSRHINLLFFSVTAMFACNEKPAYNNEDWSYEPMYYTVQRTTDSIRVDGDLNEESWRRAEFSPSFVDIRGGSYELPYLDTKFKLLWDDNYLYIAAVLEENDIWATYIERESIIFHENNFEIFLDPDMDTHDYMEYEINALGTEWDLLMERPYRNGGPSITPWNFEGMKSAIYLNGTINDHSDKDSSWQIEIAIPFNAIESELKNKVPAKGDYWRANFSRVQWHIEPMDRGYAKILGTNGKPLREENWVWSPTGRIDMHMPERWGYLYFADDTSTTQVIPHPSDNTMWALRQLFYTQRSYFEFNDEYAEDINLLGLDNADKIELRITKNGYIGSMVDETGKKWYIRNDSKIWSD